MVRLDGDVECNAWMVLHGMVQYMMYRSNWLWYAQVRGMEHFHRNGERRLVVLYSRGDWRTHPPWDRAFLHEVAIRLHAGA